jgi:uncharacterized integral membrane protein
MGLSAAAIQAFFHVQPPVADGISFLGHPVYLLKWIINHVFGTTWSISSPFVVYPALTVIGVLIGSFIGAYRSKEFRLRPGPVRKNFLAAIYGFLVVNFGLFWGACPIGTALLVSYGSVLAVIALGSIILGVLIACVLMRAKANKGINK